MEEFKPANFSRSQIESLAEVFAEKEIFHRLKNAGFLLSPPQKRTES